MKKGDDVQIVNPNDIHYGRLGMIETLYIDNSALVEFDDCYNLYKKDELYILKPGEIPPIYPMTSPPFSPPSHALRGDPVISRGSWWDEPTGISLSKQSCRHVWKTDSYFSARVYTTCSKCGKKQEDEENNDFGLPF